MKNKLINKTIRAAALLIATVIFVVSFAVYINCGAVLGSKVETPLHITSGDPSVLAGISFNTWSNAGYHTKDYSVSNVLRNAVSFNETGQPKVTSYSQVYENAYLKDYFYRDGYLYLTQNMELSFSAAEFNTSEHPSVAVQGFQIDNNLKDMMKFDEYYASMSNQYYLVDKNFYFTVTNSDIYSVIANIYQERGSNVPAFELEHWPFSLTSGIFRTDGKTIENILPIEIASENNDTKIFDLEYIPQTKCLALSVAENFNEAYVYIYHLETGAVEKHYIAAYQSFSENTGEWDIPIQESWLPLFVNDNLVVAAAGKFLACIETDKTAGSFRRHRFKYKHDFGYLEGNLINTYGNGYNCFFNGDEFFYVVSVDWSQFFDRDNVFDGYKLRIRVFNKEGELVFDGYILFSQEERHPILTISDEIPFKTEDGLAVKRYVATY